MPVLLFAFGLALVIAIAAGHHRKPAPKSTQTTAKAKDPGAPPESTVELDHGLPEGLLHQVLEALASETSPAHLEHLATELHTRYPLTALALQARADVLRARGVTESAVALPAEAPRRDALPEHPAPGPAHPVPQAPPQAPHPSRELHAASILQAAMRALVEETDPVVLDGFAESIHEPYPLAAALLAQRAHALRTAARAAPAAAGPTIVAVGAPSTAPVAADGGATPAVVTGSQS